MTFSARTLTLAASLTLGMLLLCVSGAKAEEPVPTARYYELLESGKAALEKDRPSKAAKKLSKACSLAPRDSFECLELLGRALVQSDRDSEALPVFEQVFEFPEAHTLLNFYWLSRLTLREKGPEDLKHLASSLTTEPLSGELKAAAYNALGVALSELDPEDASFEAEEAFRKSAELAKAFSGLPELNLSELLLKKGRLAQARESLGRYISGRSQRGQQSPCCLLKGGEPHWDREAMFEVERETLPEGPWRYATGDRITGPKRIHYRMPQYTPEARHVRTQGVVILSGILDRDGKLYELEVLKGLPHGLSEAALAAAEAAVFEPAKLDGEPVAVYWNLSTSFSLQ